MIAWILTRLGLGGLGLKSAIWLFMGALGLAFAVWISTKLYLAGVYSERIRAYEAVIAQIKADLIANEVIARQAEADARAAEAEEQKLKELIDAMQSDKSCPLTREHVDGVRRIDESP
ncbi:hypothetical protein [Taklimakanibacter lacteus]|uniref:hypothetical protein n=1 Tax=Taklimakanibacter lacteus TaxID=2268456 RepID=UPI000E66683A